MSENVIELIVSIEKTKTLTRIWTRIETNIKTKTFTNTPKILESLQNVGECYE